MRLSLLPYGELDNRILTVLQPGFFELMFLLPRIKVLQKAYSYSLAENLVVQHYKQ